MNEIKWEFVEPLVDENVLDDFEIDYAFEFPDIFKNFIIKNNGAIPDKKLYDVPCKGMVLAGLLSFNQNGEENIYMVLDNFIEEGRITMLPFGTDGFGNFVCLKGKQIVFWDHETDIAEKIADSFSEFINMLY